MQVGPYVDALQNDLSAIAAVGGDEVAAAAERLAAAIRASAGLRLLDALSEAALEISAQLPSGHVEVRLAGQDPSLVYVEGAQPDAQPPTADELSARITLRLPEALKGALEAAAAREGVSVNTWIVRALGRAVSSPAPRRSRHRLTGFGQS
jgi:predicted HicB family RNase H-like nuclease